MVAMIKDRRVYIKLAVPVGLLVLLALLLSACGESGSNPGHIGSRQVQIAENDFRITSSVKTFIPDVSYHFIVKNNGRIAHEFMIMPMAMSNMDGMSMDDMDHMSLAAVEDIAPGQVKTLDLTIPATLAGTQLQFACHYPGHYGAGMSLNVAVNA